MFEDYPAAKWILIWSTLPIALVAGFYLLKEWVTNKIKQRSDVAKNGKNDLQHTDEFKLGKYVDTAEMRDLTQIYIAREDKPTGPFTPRQVKDFLEQGVLRSSDLAIVASDTADGWIPLAELIKRMNPEDFEPDLKTRVSPSSGNKTQQMEIQDLVGANIQDATHMVLEHERVAFFRWVSLIELPFLILLFLLFLPCALVLALILAVKLGDETGGDGLIAMVKWSLKGIRFHYHKHQLILRVYGAGESVLAESKHIPHSKEAAENLIFDLLESTHQQKLVLVEMLGRTGDKTKTYIKEHLVTWYGGRPLMALQKDFIEKDSEAALLQKGWKIDEIPDGFLCSREVEENEVHWPIWVWIFIHVIFPPSLFLLLFGYHRKRIRDSWLYWHKDRNPVWEFMIKADHLRLTKKRWRRNASRLEEKVFFDIHGRDLIGICHAAGLSYDDQSDYESKSVKIYTNEGIITLPGIKGVSLEHLSNWITSVTLSLRAKKPELGLGYDPDRPSKCPYCGSIYVFKPGQSCPSCGGWPDRIN